MISGTLKIIYPKDIKDLQSIARRKVITKVITYKPMNEKYLAFFEK